MTRCASMLAALTLTLTLAFAAPAAAQAVADSPQLQAWVDAFNSRDPKRIVALYAPDAALWGTTARTLAKTPDEIWAYFKDTGQRPLLRVEVQSVYTRTIGDLIVASGAYRFGEVQGETWTNVRPARFTFVFRRAGDRWLIVEHHSSRVPEP